MEEKNFFDNGDPVEISETELSSAKTEEIESKPAVATKKKSGKGWNPLAV